MNVLVGKCLILFDFLCGSEPGQRLSNGLVMYLFCMVLCSPHLNKGKERAGFFSGCQFMWHSLWFHVFLPLVQEEDCDLGS